MKQHEFMVVLASLEESEDDANTLYEAGCADGSISTWGGVTRINFHREAASLRARKGVGSRFATR